MILDDRLYVHSDWPFLLQLSQAAGKIGLEDGEGSMARVGAPIWQVGRNLVSFGR